MAEIQEVRVPDIGDVDEVLVAEVLVSAGDTVAVDDSLIALESDKASMEVPAPHAGKVVEVKVAIGDEVKHDDLILTMEADVAAENAAAAEPATPVPEPPATEEPAPARPPVEELAFAPPKAAEPAPAPTPAPAPEIDERGFRLAYASPSVRRLARKLGVDLGQVQGTGRKGRIVKQDVRSFVKAALAGGTSRAIAGAAVTGFEWPEIPEIDYSKFGDIEVKPLSRISKLSAKNLHRSWLHVPHVTQHDEADITEMEAFRKAHAEEAKKQGFKLTPVAFQLKATAAALQAFPTFNSSLDASGENLILKKYFHIGVAVDTPNGLVVPVVRDVDKKGIFELAQELLETSGRAREGKLTPMDFQGACFTISSLGGIGGTAFTPIVNAPEVAILGVSRSSMKPIWRGGDFVPRLMLPLSLSYDHRVIDGATAARFIVHLSALLGDIRKLLL
ncbi:MAG: dihydrolipoyllysine-residue acetyltransferase [bacterium]|nr:dihydrolipoyllysine-residue acetyltransferase [bacterium]